MSANLPLRKSFYILLAVAALLWTVLFFFGIRQTGLPWNAPLGNLGLFGDFFGVVNSLFTGVAMCGAVYALLLQIWYANDQKKHEMDLLRSAKIEEVATLHFTSIKRLNEIVDALKELPSDRNMTDHQSGEIRRIFREMGHETYRNTVLVGLYFKSLENKLMPQTTFVAGVSGPFEKFAKQKTEVKRLEAFHEFATSMQSYLDEIADSLKFIMTNSEIIIRAEAHEKK